MTVKIENNFEDFKNKLLNNIQKAGQEAFITELAEIQSNTPVETGNLKRSITGESKKINGVVKIAWGSKVVYARKVEFKDKSYIRSTLKRDIVRIEAIFNKYIGESAK
ncbi:HK97 gp10 family phage protein [Clostridium perfringens]|uniref:HK97 gp10 family phage protein n=1 Tax=Clostridium perfringens TaxID=1502 RepID=UPI00096A792B|nr:HK97 gp10 family phage protein [Clostridium perfringens]MDM0458201.1 HK97 gp10 family phage protein [Clostridium perfringens]MDM0973278.1 HK97 gp10 family phage protein [Clostridium perfringens]